MITNRIASSPVEKPPLPPSFPPEPEPPICPPFPKPFPPFPKPFLTEWKPAGNSLWRYSSQFVIGKQDLGGGDGGQVEGNINRGDGMKATGHVVEKLQQKAERWEITEVEVTGGFPKIIEVKVKAEKK